MKNWKIYSIVITIILILAIISGILYFFVFKENITEDEAKRIAFEHAGVSENDITILTVNKDKEDREYEISFFDDFYEYEVNVNYNSSKIDSYEKDIRDDVNINNNYSNNRDNLNNNVSNNVNSSNTDLANNINNNANTNNSSMTNTTNNQYIGEQKAKEIAVNHAGLTGNQVSYGKFELDRDHGKSIYEIEFYYDYMEYDYEIDAITGEVLKFEKGR